MYSNTSKLAVFGALEMTANLETANFAGNGAITQSPLFEMISSFVMLCNQQSEKNAHDNTL